MVFLASFFLFFRFFWFFLVLQNIVNASDVLKLDEMTFKETIQNSGIFLVEFFAPWCGHCKALAPEYEEAATALKDKGVTLIQVDCTAETRLCDSYEVSGYPTLKIFRDGQHTPYDGPRKAQAIVSYMIKQTLPAITSLKYADFETFKTSDEVVLLALLEESDKSNHNIYSNVATKNRNKYLFGLSSDPEFLNSLNLPFPSLVLFRKFDGLSVVYEGSFDEESIQAFLLKESLPLLGELHSETYEAYILSKLPLGCIFVGSDDEKNDMINLFLPLAKEYRGKINFATIDATLYGGHAENLNLQQSWPAFAIQETVSNKKYPFDQSLFIDYQKVSVFLSDYFSNKLSPSIRSQPIPETQNGPVYVVVANNFQELVIDTPKDVLLEFYAPWCGHCKNLAPKYDSLGEIFMSNPELNSKVMIAKIDATANDFDDTLDVKGFPTILLFPANDKKNPVEYSGPRTVESLIEFIHLKGSHKVDASSDAYKKPDQPDKPVKSDSLGHDEL